MPTTPGRALTWTWSDALRCGLCTLPAALIVLTGDPSRGPVVVLVMLLYADPTVANEQWRFAERVGETILGVGLAYVFGLLLPTVLTRFGAGPTWSE